MENKYTNRYVLETGIGLQDVDHLKNSSYFVQESERYLRGEISLDELDEIIEVAGNVPLSKKVVVDPNEITDIIKEIRHKAGHKKDENIHLWQE